VPATEVRAFVGVGANLGDAESTVRDALRSLGRIDGCRLGRCSPLYRSAPWQAQGPDFINAVAELQTMLPAVQLLNELQAIETAGGRVRSVPSAPRTLDLDLLLYGDLVQHGATLTLPHPRLHQRAFVLRPLADIDPGLILPGLGPIGPWLEQAAAQRIERIGRA